MPFPKIQEECVIQKVGRVDENSHREIEGFLDSLSEEKAFFRAGVSEIEKAEVLLAARVEERIVGLYGIVRRFFRLPCVFVIVEKGYQRKGIGKLLHETRRPFCAKYFFLFSIVARANERAQKYFASVNEYKLYEDGQYVFYVSAQKRASLLFLPLLKRIFPVVLRIWRAFQPAMT